MRRVPQCTYTNLYGPTEATIASSYYTVDSIPESETTAIPIGAPCGGEDIHVLDEELQPVAPGEIGEFYIEGAGLSPGYWRDEEKTREAFLIHPRTGQRLYRTGDLGRRDEHRVLHFVGRADSQIKSRGYRIELGEIETALTAIDGVAECAVVGVPSEDFDGTAICCAWASRQGAELGPRQLRSSLSDALPSYMLPGRWLSSTCCPRTPTARLTVPRCGGDSLTMQTMDEVADIARAQLIFEDALNVQAPDPEVDLIDSGLIDSLALVTLIFEIEQEFGVRVPLETLDVEDFRTISNIVRMVHALEREAAS